MTAMEINEMSKDKKKNHVDETENEVKEETVETETPEEAKVEESKTEESKVSSEMTEVKEKFLRLAADFENYKKRSKAEKESLYGMAVAETVEKFLPVIDDMERAAAAADDGSPLKKGVEQVTSKFKTILENLGVTELGEKGEKFDVAIHEAIMQGESDGCEEGTVLEVFQKGYKLGDKVVRYAKVKVSV